MAMSATVGFVVMGPLITLSLMLGGCGGGGDDDKPDRSFKFESQSFEGIGQITMVDNKDGTKTQVPLQLESESYSWNMDAVAGNLRSKMGTSINTMFFTDKAEMALNLDFSTKMVTIFDRQEQVFAGSGGNGSNPPGGSLDESVGAKVQQNCTKIPIAVEKDDFLYCLGNKTQDLTRDASGKLIIHVNGSTDVATAQPGPSSQALSSSEEKPEPVVFVKASWQLSDKNIIQTALFTTQTFGFQLNSAGQPSLIEEDSEVKPKDGYPKAETPPAEVFLIPAAWGECKETQIKDMNNTRPLWVAHQVLPDIIRQCAKIPQPKKSSIQVVSQEVAVAGGGTKAVRSGDVVSFQGENGVVVHNHANGDVHIAFAHGKRLTVSKSSLVFVAQASDALKALRAGKAADTSKHAKVIV
jgi:hypothetical protein